MNATRVFLTGATGYLGGEILRQLLQAGFLVRALVRPGTSPGLGPEVELATGDLAEAARLPYMIEGCMAVFHCAALVSNWVRNQDDFYATNVQGLVNVMEAVRKSSVSTLVYTSSFFALGPSPMPGASEDSGLNGLQLHPYQHSKLLARHTARRARAEGFPIVILYPGVIYGPGKRTQGNLVAQLATDFVRGRIPGLLGSGRQVWSYSFIRDVARGHLLALERSPAGGEFVLGGDNVCLRDFFETLARLAGRPAPRLKIPVALGVLVAGARMALARLSGRSPEMTPAAVRMMYHSWACDSSKARTELGYQFRSLEDGLRETLQSLNISIVR